MSDLLHQNFCSHQSNEQPGPVTQASATTLAPTTLITFLSGTTSIATITPPVTGQHRVVLIATVTTLATVTTGNIALATTLVANKALELFYDPNGAKYYPSY